MKPATIKQVTGPFYAVEGPAYVDLWSVCGSLDFNGRKLEFIVSTPNRDDLPRIWKGYVNTLLQMNYAKTVQVAIIRNEDLQQDIDEYKDIL